MTVNAAERSLNRSYDFAKTRQDKTLALLERTRDVAGTRRAIVPVARPPSPPLEVTVWMEHADKRVKVIWLNHSDFPEKVVSKEEMDSIRNALNVYFERCDKRQC